jgi:hypothetical protein
MLPEAAIRSEISRLSCQHARPAHRRQTGAGFAPPGTSSRRASAAKPAGTQTSFNTQTFAELAQAQDPVALFIPLTVEWVPAFAGMTTVGMRTPRSTSRFPSPPPCGEGQGWGWGCEMRGGFHD